MEYDSLDLPAISDLSSNPYTRYSELEEILGVLRPQLDDGIELVKKGWKTTMDMTIEFVRERHAGLAMNRDWPFAIDDYGKVFVFGGKLRIQARTPELAKAYLEELKESVVAKIPEHMQNCLDLEELFARYEPFAKDMVLLYTTIDTLQENRAYHNTLVAIGKGPFSIDLTIDMQSRELEYYHTNGDPSEFFDPEYQTGVRRNYKRHNIYIVGHPSKFITSEELFRYASFLMDEKYNAMQQEASAIKKEMAKFGLISGAEPGKDSSN